ncbi:hypothetical protein PAECIP111893_04793 [Paenibacillus plantiphilus]|uniref:Copper amine oxidase N-terminal domain-containing protein n=1 Tax=Paenibacillus plantiphilus TaxID=2905650 RepID=A0ABN8GY61_9BACL|nr:stalk domain-containing protein [Paenibacillus plantiphilus]CAH1221864.1 hypothetical protein PAECIP111893_04793 [Paenibacillus plantiphilus]
MKRKPMPMKKAVVGASLVLLLSLPAAVSAAQDVLPNTAASTNNNAQTEQSKQILVPAKAVAESLGAKVKWDAKSKLVTIQRGENELVLTVGKSQAAIDGKPADIGHAVVIKDGRAMVPLAIINAAFGTAVNWDIAAGTVSFETDDYAGLAGYYVYSLFNGQHDVVLSLMNEELKKALPEERLGLLVQQLSAVYGQPKMQQSLAVGVNGVHTNVSMAYTMKGASLDFTIRFDADGRIDDLAINPMSVTAAFGKPAYDRNNYTEQEIVIGEGTFALPGTLTLPQGEGPHPVVVMVHGSGPHDRDSTIGGAKIFKDIAVGLASHNIAVLRYEKVTKEHTFKVSAQPKFTLKNESVDDVLQAVNLLKNTQGIDPSRIYIAGHSQGGYVMPLILDGDREVDIAGAILLSAPSEQMTDVLIEQQNNALARLQQAGLPEEMQAAQKQAVAVWTGIAELVQNSSYSKDNLPQNFPIPPAYWWYEQRDYVPAEFAQKQTKPMLILQGENDWQVSMKQYEGWKEALKARNDISYISYPKVNHLLVEYDGVSVGMEYNNPAHVSATIIKDMAEWIGKGKSQ